MPRMSRRLCFALAIRQVRPPFCADWAASTTKGCRRPFGSNASAAENYHAVTTPAIRGSENGNCGADLHFKGNTMVRYLLWLHGWSGRSPAAQLTIVDNLTRDGGPPQDRRAAPALSVPMRQISICTQEPPRLRHM